MLALFSAEVALAGFLAGLIAVAGAAHATLTRTGLPVLVASLVWIAGATLARLARRALSPALRASS